MPRKSWSAKRERQYGHLRKSGASKRVAAATVNKTRARKGETKSRRSKRKS